MLQITRSTLYFKKDEKINHDDLIEHGYEKANTGDYNHIIYVKEEALHFNTESWWKDNWLEDPKEKNNDD